jgi:hypothetical protein
VSAVDGEDLKAFPIDISNPTGDIGSLAIRRRHDGISVGGEPRLTGRKLLQSPESNPRVVVLRPVTHNGREDVTQDGSGENHANDAIEGDSNLHEECAPR